LTSGRYQDKDMDLLADYYMHQGGGGHQDDLFGPVYVGIPYVQADTESAASSQAYFAP
jgi:hypothetical protein